MQLPAGLRTLILRKVQSRQTKYILGLSFALFFLFECYVMSKHIWVGDLWTHIPPILEFAKNTSVYENPWINSPLPDVYMTPFHWFWGKMLLLTQTDVLSLMVVSGVVNMIFLYFSVRWFSRIVLKEKGVLFQSLLIFTVLFFWGYNPWDYSGFFHFRFINFVLPYPSTVGFCLLLNGITLLQLLLNDQRGRMSFLLLTMYNTVCFAFLFLTHPLTFIFYNAAIASFFLSELQLKRFNNKAFLASYVVPIVISAGLVVIYPYYPVLDFFKSGGDNFHFANWNMYDDQPVLRLLPVLFTLPLVFRLPQEKYSFIKIFFSLLAILYIIGYFTGKYSYGRSISLIYFCVQVAVVIYVKDFYDRHIRDHEPLALGNGLYALGIFLLFLINVSAAPRTAYNLLTAPALDIAAIEDIRKETGQQSIVVSPDKALLQKLPTFLGKGIVPLQPTIWIKDEEERQKNLDSFFYSANPEVYGRQLLRKYGVTHVMVPNNSEFLSRFRHLNHYSNEKYSLFRVTDIADRKAGAMEAEEMTTAH